MWDMLSRRQFIALSGTALVFLPRVGRAAGDAYGIVGERALANVEVIDCEWVEEYRARVTRKLVDLSRPQTPDWFGEDMSELQKALKSQEAALAKLIATDEKNLAQAEYALIGELAATVAAFIGAVALAKGRVYLAGSAVAVSVLASPVVLTVQAVRSAPDSAATLEFVLLNFGNRVSLLLGNSGKTILKRLGSLLTLAALGYAYGKAEVMRAAWADHQRDLRRVREEVARMTADESYARGIVEGALKESLSVLDFLRRHPNCRPPMTPIPREGSLLLTP